MAKDKLNRSSAMPEVEEMLRRWVEEARAPALEVSFFFFYALIDWAEWRLQERFRREFTARLQRSSVLERIALEGVPTERAIGYVPAYLRWLFPRMSKPPRTLREALAEMSLNLDWYLEPPRPLVRWHWIAPLLGVGAIALGLLGLIVMVTPSLLGAVPWLVLLGLLFPLSMPAGIGLIVFPPDIQAVRVKMMRGALAAELLWRLGLSASPPAAPKPEWLRKREALPDDPA
jgi:hypothetical protein